MYDAYGRAGRLKTYVRQRVGTETDSHEKTHIRAFFTILIDNKLNMATNLAQQHSIVATAGTCPTKLSNILSDELEKIISSPGIPIERSLHLILQYITQKNFCFTPSHPNGKKKIGYRIGTKKQYWLTSTNY